MGLEWAICLFVYLLFIYNLLKTLTDRKHFHEMERLQAIRSNSIGDEIFLLSFRNSV